MSKRISDLTATTTAQATDLVELSADNGVGGYTSKKITVDNLKNAVAGAEWGDITGTLSTQTDLQNALDAKQDDLISGTNIKTINGNSVLGSGNLVVGGSSGITVGTTAVTSGTVGRVFFQGSGDVVQQDSALFWDNTNKRLGVGSTPSTSVRLDVRAQGALSTDIAFRVRNSADTANLVSVSGNGNFKINSGTYYTEFDSSKGLVVGNSFGDWGRISPIIGVSSYLNSPLGIGTTNVLNNFHSYSTNNNYKGLRIGVGASSAANESCGMVFSTTFAGTSFGVDALEIISRTKGSGAALTSSVEFNLNKNSVLLLRASITSQSNFLLQTPTEDTNDIGVIYVPNGTAPTASINDGYKQYSADIVAGNAAPHFRTEAGDIIKLYKQSSAGISTVADLVTVLTNLGLLG